jgi:DNA processing protein
VWLGTLAWWRGGLVGLLVREYGEVDDVLGRPVSELRAFLKMPPPRPAAAGPAVAGRAGSGGPPAQDHTSERRRYDAVREAAPQACAAGHARPGRVLVTWCDAPYPASLRHLADPPLCLFAAATADDAELYRRLGVLGEVPAVAVVGTRAPSPYGAEMATMLGRDLALKGVVVVSGLAMGVDATAQAAALRAGGPPGGPATVAVMGCGADVAYPSCNAALHREVLRHGLVVSEFGWGVPARAWRFPARNRVMAALSQAVVVVEGARRSGARITADFALDLGREVLAVPGEAGKKLTQAPHGFLRQGATLCESADDVVTALIGEQPESVQPANGQVARPAAAEPARLVAGGRFTGVLSALERTPLTADQVAEECGVRVQVAAALLSELEIEGLVAPAGGGAYRLRRV